MLIENRRKNLFNSFESIEPLPKLLDNSFEKRNYFSFEDPFDFYRTKEKKKAYLPLTQIGLRKAFSKGLIGIEHFISMAASLRPLIDEAQDINEITRLFSQQKLSARPSQHSAKILKNMIKDQNIDIALYAAEGLNSIENSYIEKIQKIKEKIYEKKGERFILNYIIGRL